ncbi:MAG TPA: hypothetical protein VKB79_23790 [Bryobacteraceae bacterium]|nr:hypothetical protein [Bryobacteraceae bacterium]
MPCDVKAYILSCPDREEMRLQTIRNLAATDWFDEPEVEIDRTTCERRQERQERTALSLLQRAIDSKHELILFLEDDLDFNRRIRHNLENWYPLSRWRPSMPFFASLYNPGVGLLTKSPQRSFCVANPNGVFGSQAFLMSSGAARYITEHWWDVIGMQDIKMSRLAARLCPIYYHSPSLVQHIGVVSAWGGNYHCARDFDESWSCAA